MIPILYGKNETSFTTNGLGRLAECLKCVVTEERNGTYELEFDYPVSGLFYSELINGCDDNTDRVTVGVIHDDHHDIQPFDVYSYSAPINGIVTFYAHHISYRLSRIVVNPYTAESPASAITGLSTYAAVTNPFSFWTDKTGGSTFYVDVPTDARSLLCGSEGSILDVYGKGEYQFDKFDVKLYLNRGTNTGVTIRYGKNLADITKEIDVSSEYNTIIPYWKGSVDEQDVVVYTTPIRSSNAPSAMPTLAIAHDFSSDFDGQPTAEQLENIALSYLDNNTPWVNTHNIKVDFVALWQTAEYDDYSLLQRVSLCDTVSVFYPELGVIADEQKVIKTEYDVLLERYNSIEIGDRKTTFGENMVNEIDSAVSNIDIDIEGVTQTELEAAIQTATDLINGGLGGYVVTNVNANGQPQEILIMDTANINTAVNVIRINKNGIGFSTSGYNGPFSTAWTIDGKFNASYILAGTMSANYIKGGTLKLGGASNGNGILQVLNSSNTVITTLNNSGISVNGNITMTSSNPNFSLNMTGVGTNGKFEINNSYWRINSDNNGYMQTFVHTSPSSYDWTPPAGESAMGLRSYYQASNGKIFESLISAYYFNIKYTSGGSLQNECTIASGNFMFGNVNNQHGISYIYGQSMILAGDPFYVLNATKSGVLTTDDYSNRVVYSYETPTPTYGDIGEGTIDAEGICYVFIDSIFAEMIDTSHYQVFLQKYGSGDCYVSERKPGYFVVTGTPNLEFGWEMKARRKDDEYHRLDAFDYIGETSYEETIDYGDQGCYYFEQLMEGRW